MRREDAIKKLGKLLGKSLGYRVDPKAPDADEREEALIKLRAATATRNDLKTKMEARRSVILEADAEYRSLLDDWKAASEAANRLMSLTNHYRFTVGTSNGMFFVIKAQGDSWEEVIAKLKAERLPS